VVTEVVLECKDWMGKEVMISGIAKGTVASFDIPMKLFPRTANAGPLQAGAVRVTNIQLISPSSLYVFSSVLTLATKDEDEE